MKKNQEGDSLCALSRWKIFDNLRRSLVPLSKTLVVLLNLAWIPKAFYLWLPLVFFQDMFSLVILLLAVIIQKLIRPKLALVYKGFTKELAAMLYRAFLEFTITPYRGYVASELCTGFLSAKKICFGGIRQKQWTPPLSIQEEDIFLPCGVHFYRRLCLW